MTTLRFGTGSIGMTSVCLLILGSCSYGEPYVEPFAAPERRTKSLPEICRHLYNVGRSLEWQICMGVGPKEAP